MISAIPTRGRPSPVRNFLPMWALESDDDGARALPRAVSADSDSESEGEEEEVSEG